MHVCDSTIVMVATGHINQTFGFPDFEQGRATFPAIDQKLLRVDDDNCSFKLFGTIREFGEIADVFDYSILQVVKYLY